MSAVARKYGIADSVLHSWKKKFPPKSFALVEVSSPDFKPLDPPSTLVVAAPPLSTSPQPQTAGAIRVIFQKCIVVEFPLSAEPSAIAQFVKALEG